MDEVYDNLTELNALPQEPIDQGPGTTKSQLNIHLMLNANNCDNPKSLWETLFKTNAPMIDLYTRQHGDTPLAYLNWYGDTVNRIGGFLQQGFNEPTPVDKLIARSTNYMNNAKVNWRLAWLLKYQQWRIQDDSAVAKAKISAAERRRKAIAEMQADTASQQQYSPAKEVPDTQCEHRLHNYMEAEESQDYDNLYDEATIYNKEQRLACNGEEADPSVALFENNSDQAETDFAVMAKARAAEQRTKLLEAMKRSQQTDFPTPHNF